MILRSTLAALLLLLTSTCVQGQDNTRSTNIKSLLNTANVHMAGGDFSSAIAILDQAISLDKQNYQAIFKRGAAHLQLGKTAQAARDFEEVLTLRPNFEGALLQRAKMKAKEADWASAKRDYLAAGRKGGQEIADLDEAQAAADLAVKAEKDADWEACVTHAGAAIMTASAALHLRQLRARCRFERGEVLEGAGDLMHVVQISPGSTEPHLQISAMLFYTVGDTERALTQIRKCLHSDPDSKACSKMFRREKALNKAYTKMKEHKAKGQFHSLAKILVGNGADDLGLISDIRSDIKEYKEAGIIHKNSPDDLLSLLFDATCEAYIMGQKYKQAIPHCAEALKLNPNSLYGAMSVGQQQIVAEQFEEAIKTLKKALEVHGANAAQGKLHQKLQEAEMLLRRRKQRDYYKVLDLPRDADAAMIKSAYRKKTKEFHPDRAIRTGVSKEEAERKTAEVIQAYEVLSDAELKARYDRGDDPNDQSQQSHHFQHPFGGGQQFFFNQGGGGFKFAGGHGFGGM
ncbi:MAG: hypothetical protein M1829_006592 [Trizodia sp. TS-e1964]|nr:MAG: hypothetical protein M1829_006592 [Trizodia sp. TS-e1964]